MAQLRVVSRLLLIVVTLSPTWWTRMAAAQEGQYPSSGVNGGPSDPAWSREQGSSGGKKPVLKTDPGGELGASRVPAGVAGMDPASVRPSPLQVIFVSIDDVRVP